MPGDDRGAVLEHRPAVELALAAGDALDHEARVAPDQDAHAAAPFAAATALAAASSRLAAVTKLRRLQQLRRLGRRSCPRSGRPSGPSRTCWARASIRPLGDLVATGDAAEDVDEDRLDVGVLEDQPHRGRHAVRLGAAADVEEVGRLAAGALDEVHRGHREAGAVDHAADVAVELDERQVVPPRLDVGRVLGVEVPQLLELRVAGERRVVEGDLGVEAHQPLDRRAVRVVLPDDRERVDLHEVRVVGEHRPQQALRDRGAGLPVRARSRS